MEQSTQYDNFATVYDEWAKFPAEMLSQRAFRRTIGTADGLSVLDMACGTGIFSRMLVSLGAKYVVGVDLSSSMVDIAQRAPSPNANVSIQYRVVDCGKPFNLPKELRPPEAPTGQFDLVTMCWLLNYAPDQATLLTMYQNIARHLAPWGRFVGITENFDPNCTGYQPKYGISSTVTRELPDGGFECSRVAHVPGNPTSFQTYTLPRSMHERAAAGAGLRDLKFELPGYDMLDEQEGEQREFWKDFLEGGSYFVIVSGKKVVGA